MREYFKKFDHGIGWVEDVVSVFSLTIITILVVVGVFLRYVLNTGMLWADEVILNLMVVMVMFGSPAAVRRFMHTDMQVFVNMMSKPVRIAVKILTTIVGLSFLLLFLYSSVEFTFNAKGLFTTVLRVPMPYVYSFMPLGALLMLYEYIKVVPETVKDKKETTNNTQRRR